MNSVRVCDCVTVYEHRDLPGGAQGVVEHPGVSEGVAAAAGPAGRAAHGLHGGGSPAGRAAGAGAAGQEGAKQTQLQQHLRWGSGQGHTAVDGDLRQRVLRYMTQIYYHHRLYQQGIRYPLLLLFSIFLIFCTIP